MIAIMIGPPTNSARVNCQPISSARMMPELDHEVGRGELERHRRGEVGALAEERACQRDGGIRARRRRRARDRRRSRANAGESSGSRPVISDFETTACTTAGQGEPQDQRPQDLPGHAERELQRMGDGARQRPRGFNHRWSPDF